MMNALKLYRMRQQIAYLGHQFSIGGPETYKIRHDAAAAEVRNHCVHCWHEKKNHRFDDKCLFEPTYFEPLEP